jgi:hypothetical protein
MGKKKNTRKAAAAAAENEKWEAPNNQVENIQETLKLSKSEKKRQKQVMQKKLAFLNNEADKENCTNLITEEADFEPDKCNKMIVKNMNPKKNYKGTLFI